MKKLLLLFALICIAFAFDSCKKNSQGNNCWTCTVKLKTYEPPSAGGGYFITSSKEKICDKTEDEIRYYENARKNTGGTADGGRMETEVSCTK